MSSCMYKIRPLVNHHEPLPISTHNMYQIKPFQGNEVTDPPRSVHLNELTEHVQKITQGSLGDMAALEKQQEYILKKLAQLKLDMKSLRLELNAKSQTTGSIPVSGSCSPFKELGESPAVVVYASPDQPPHSLCALTKLWGATCPLALQNCTHSSVKEAPSFSSSFFNGVSGAPHLSITLVWKDVGSETELVTNPVKHTAVHGETNILRFLCRIGPKSLMYENDKDLIRVTHIDDVLDICQQLARHRTAKERQAIIRSLNASLGKSQWMCGRTQLSIADIAAWSVLKQVSKSTDLTQSLKKWMEHCDSLLL